MVVGGGVGVGWGVRGGEGRRGKGRRGLEGARVGVAGCLVLVG